MRTPKPHWKESHKCWYVKLNGKFHRLDPNKDLAFARYGELMEAAGLLPSKPAASATTARRKVERAFRHYRSITKELQSAASLTLAEAILSRFLEFDDGNLTIDGDLLG